MRTKAPEIKKVRLKKMKKFLTLFLAMAMVLSLVACGGSKKEETKTEETKTEETTENAVPTGVEDGVLTIAMECAYAPYNWT